MIPLALSEIAQCTGGTVLDADPATMVSGAATVDSRLVVPQGLFVAVNGDHVDGHDYAAEAVARGAAACLVSRPVGVPAVLVADPVSALGRIASTVRSQLTGCTVIGVTGSQGKTTTKDLLLQLLSHHGETIAPVGSFNNEIGVPLTLLVADAATVYLVLEMGARGAGHIRYLCDIARPRVGAVLNVGLAHVGEFGTMAATGRAKSELPEALPGCGTAVLNLDDPLVAEMASRTRATVVTYGAHDRADLRLVALRLTAAGYPSFELRYRGERVSVTMPLVGEHQAHNGAAAAAVALAVGMDLTQVATLLSSVVATSRWRMEPHERADGVLVLNDAYNANPDSTKAALKTLAALSRSRNGSRTIAVLGEMLELGLSSDEQHHAIGRLAVRLGICRLLVVGEGARPIHRAACSENPWNGESVLVPDADAAIEWLRDRVRPSDMVLVKASRAVGLERVAAALVDDDTVRAP